MALPYLRRAWECPLDLRVSVLSTCPSYPDLILAHKH